MKRVLLASLLLIAGGCATYAGLNFDELFGPEQVQTRIEPYDHSQSQYFVDEVKPILDNRCVVCHACYDAPCQLKLTSPEGIDRGSSLAEVYQGSRLTATTPTRLYEDAHNTQEWRDAGFFPVLNERVQRSDANIQAGVMAQLLLQKQQFPLPQQDQLDDFDFGIYRSQTCPTSDTIDEYRAEHPTWGMPYGLPALSNSEHNTLLGWLRSGAKMSDVEPLTIEQKNAVDTWESYLNQPDLKRQLTSRYIYEHLFLNHIYFSEQNTLRFFKLVRSTTPPGEEFDPIVTRRPYEDPGVERVYYRLIPERETIVDKTHMPYAFNQQRMDKWTEWFDTEYDVTELPSYRPIVASNPIMAFADIPIQSRYKFLLDEAQSTIMSFIKGPVCRGQLALNVINDHFWVFFVDPEQLDNELADDFYRSQAPNMRLPGELDSNTTPVFNWVKYSRAQSKYLSDKMAFMNEVFTDDRHLGLESIWTGEGNPNAALTIFRHFDSASVVQGLVGHQPKTAWVIDYALLERIHYLLVAGFDVYGNFGHQLITRMYMDLLRIEGETAFIAFLPLDNRHQTLSSWYQGQSIEFSDYLTRNAKPFLQESGVEYKTINPKQELTSLLKARVAPSLVPRYEIANTGMLPQNEHSLKQINFVTGAGLEPVPQIISLHVELENGEDQFFSLLHNNAHTNISSLFNEESNRDPQYDRITLVKGIVGSYPAAFLSIKEREAGELARMIRSINAEEDYIALLDRFAIRRSSDEFWPLSDKLHEWYKNDQPIEFGLLDYNRFENR
jgi:hypothetical protein